MQQDNNSYDETAKTGKWMIILAWVFAFALLIVFFNDFLAKQLNPNQQPSSYQTVDGTEVSLKQNRQGHYVASGTINGQPVVFLLDTGATNVSIPFHLGEQLGLRPGMGQRVMTANGSITVARTEIDTLTIGDIQLNDISANLNPGMQGNEILLGMSALRQLEFTQRGQWLILRQ